MNYYKSQNTFQIKPKLFCLIFQQLSIEINNNNCISRLISNYEDLLKILNNNNNEQILKILYFNRSNIHNILYKSEEIIKIKNIDKLAFSELFYLTLLIMDNLELINYSYTINDIFEVNNFKREIKNDTVIKKIVISKIVIKLLKNYKDSQEYKPYNESQFELIEEENNKNVISNNCTNTFDLEKKDNIEEIYIKIINHLNNFSKIEFNEKAYNEIINELEFESIYITKNMFDSLYNILNITNKNIKNLIIINQYDLIDTKKISFYYILFKYIFKNPIYIYQIPLLLKIRKNIMMMINNKFNQISIYVKENIRQKVEYIIRFITDSEYYFNKYLEFNEQPFIEVSNYFKNYYFESKKEDIKILDKIIKNKKIIGNKNYLENLEIAKNMNEKFPIIEYLFNIEIKNDNLQKTEIEMKRFLKKWEKIEKMINQKKFKKMRKSYKIALINYFIEDNNRIILLKIFDENKLNYFISENINFLDDNFKYDDNKQLSIKMKDEETKINTN